MYNVYEGGKKQNKQKTETNNSKPGRLRKITLRYFTYYLQFRRRILIFPGRMRR